MLTWHALALAACADIQECSIFDLAEGWSRRIQPVDKLTASVNPLVHAVVDYFWIISTTSLVLSLTVA